MTNKNRGLKAITVGVVSRLLQNIAYFAFPYQLVVLLHKIRGVKVGKGSHISRYVIIDDQVSAKVIIEEGVAVTQGVMILTHQRDLKDLRPGMSIMSLDLKHLNVLIKRNAHIGIGAIIMPGVTIGEGSIIGAGAVVTKDIPDFSIAVGVPARVIKSYYEDLD